MLKAVSDESFCVVSLGTSSHCVTRYFSWFTREWKIFQGVSTALADWKVEHLEMVKSDVNILLDLDELEEVNIKEDVGSGVLKVFEERFNVVLNCFENLIAVAALGGRTGTACLNVLSRIEGKFKVKNLIAIVFLPLEKEERKRMLALTLLKNIKSLRNVFVIDLERVRELFKLDIMDTFSISDILAVLSIMNIIYLFRYHKDSVLNGGLAFFKSSGIGTFSIFDGEIESPLSEEDYKTLRDWLSDRVLYKLPENKRLFRLWLLPVEDADLKNWKRVEVLNLIRENLSDQVVFYDIKNKAISPALFVKVL